MKESPFPEYLRVKRQITRIQKENASLNPANPFHRRKHATNIRRLKEIFEERERTPPKTNVAQRK